MSYSEEEIKNVVAEYASLNHLDHDTIVEYICDEYDISQEQLEEWLQDPALYQCPYCSRLPELPKFEEIQGLREEYTKLPLELHPPLNGTHHTIGSVQIIAEDSKWTVIANIWGTQINRDFHELEQNPNYAEERLKVGWAIYAMFLHDGYNMRASIPGPNEAMEHSAPFFDGAARWVWWAIKPSL